MRAYVGLIILTIAACALASSLAWKPVQAPLAVDPHNSGEWRLEAAASPQAAPQMLFAPCPLTPQNVPVVALERRA